MPFELKVPATASRSPRSVWYRSPRYDRDDRSNESRRMRRSVKETKHQCNGREERGQYGRKRSRDDGRWGWEDTPYRDNRSTTSRYHLPSPPMMLVEASPDARLVSPRLDGYTPRSTGMLIIA